MRPIVFYLIALVVLVSDQISKRMVSQHVPLGTSVPVLKHLLWLTSTQNTGGAFSLLQARNSVFMVIAAGAIGILLYAYHHSARRNLLFSAAAALALGGAIGNLTDRVRLGYVVDFFDVHFWPIFNIADSAITISIVLLAYHFLTHRDVGTSKHVAET